MAVSLSFIRVENDDIRLFSRFKCSAVANSHDSSRQAGHAMNHVFQAKRDCFFCSNPQRFSEMFPSSGDEGSRGRGHILREDVAPSAPTTVCGQQNSSRVSCFRINPLHNHNFEIASRRCGPEFRSSLRRAPEPFPGQQRRSGCGGTARIRIRQHDLVKRTRIHRHLRWLKTV